MVYEVSSERRLIVKLKDGLSIDDVSFDFLTEYLEGQRVLDNTEWVWSFVKRGYSHLEGKILKKF